MRGARFLLLGLWPFLARGELLLVPGAPGTETYRATFAQEVVGWKKAAAAGQQSVQVIGEEGAGAKAALQQALAAAAAKSDEPLWLVLLGHGTWDGREGRFNLPGDDLTAAELGAWLQPISRPLVVVAAFSGSGAWLKPLAGPGHVVITATRTGAEENYARLGEYLAETVGDPAADLDKDGQVSLLEAWLAAANRVTTFYKDQGRLATEHSLLDDNGDARGTPPDWFQGVRAVKKATDASAVDGLRAHQLHLAPNAEEQALLPAQRAERDRLELSLNALRERKASLPETEYYAQLEKLLLELAEIYRAKK